MTRINEFEDTTDNHFIISERAWE